MICTAESSKIRSIKIQTTSTTAALAVRTQVRAGRRFYNHSETLAVRTQVRAGRRFYNHSETLAA
jgi:hypothetical protein